MKFLLGLVIVAAIVANVLVTGEINRQIDLQIPIYSNAQNVWRGRTQEKIIGYPVTRIASFTTADSKDQVLSFYKTALVNNGWSYDTSGHANGDCEGNNSFDGDFYLNSGGDHIYVALKHVTRSNLEYDIYRVPYSFWQYGECP